MNVGEIIKDSLKYPFSDWKKFLIFGIIIVFANIYFDLAFLTQNYVLLFVLGVIGFIFGLFAFGYMFKIIKSSLKGINKLPEFNWINMGFEGVKVFIVYIVYLIPVILIILLLWLNMHSSLNEEIAYINPINYLFIPLISIIWPGIIALILSLLELPMIIPEVFTISYLGILYTFLVIPLILVAIANMAYYEGELKSGFRFREIFEEISLIGWKNLIKWYIATGIIFLTLFIIILAVFIFFDLLYSSYISDLNQPPYISTIQNVILALTIIPYVYIFISRSVALFYMPYEEK